MPVKVKETNPGWLDKLRERYEDAEIAVGLPKGSEGAGVRYPDGTDLLNVAFWNEFGIGVPERPFIRAGVRANLDSINELAGELVKKVNSGDISIETAAETLGIKAASDVKNYIVELSSPPNSPATIRAKKSSNPLVDTGLLNQSITHDVRMK